MQASSAVSSILNSKSDLISPQQVDADYGIPERTQAVWRCTNRYGWRDMAIHVGRLIRYKRPDIEAWLESRRGPQK